MYGTQLMYPLRLQKINIHTRIHAYTCTPSFSHALAHICNLSLCRDDSAASAACYMFMWRLLKAYLDLLTAKHLSQTSF